MKGFFQFGSPMIGLVVEGKKIEMLLDTGFNGHLMLPQAEIDELGLEQIGISDYLTASGQSKLTKVYIANIWFFDSKIEAPVLSTDANFSLAGMELFQNCRIVIERNKKIVEIRKSK